MITVDSPYQDSSGSFHLDKPLEEPALKYGFVDRDRWNVLDLLTIFGARAVTTHVFYDIDMGWEEDKRKALEKERVHITVTAFLLKAIAIAQLNHPASRTILLPGLRIVVLEDVTAGFTVEREVHGKPVVFFGEIERAHEKPLTEIASELKDYVEKDIDQMPKLKEQLLFTRFPWLARQLIFHIGSWIPRCRLICMRATFGLSSLGALGVKSAFGPSVCTSVFGVGKVEDRVVVKDGKVVSRPMLSLALSFDQRVMDGGQAAEFVLEVKRLLEGELEKHLV
ncbi:hypothetical protein GC174_03515 [bacterium]|nr:hypothetical protein [bacterium]